MWKWTFWEQVGQDLRYALRQLIHSPGFALAAIVSLALGISATVAVFSVVWAVLMNPYPYAAPDRMVHMRLTEKDGRNRYFGLTGSQWQVIRHSPAVEDAFMTDEWNLTVTGHDLPEDVNADYVTSNTFQFLGVPPALGRGLLPSDAVDGHDPQPFQFDRPERFEAFEPEERGGAVGEGDEVGPRPSVEEIAP